MLSVFGYLFIIEVALILVLMLIHKADTNVKLRIIRCGVLFISSVVILAAKLGVKAAEPFKLPLTWLRHYVWGSGTAMRVPDEIVRDAKSAIRKALMNGEHIEPFGRYCCLYHSTLYEGRGFYNRPTLFYLVGGFTFLLRRDGKVSGKDRYDWHSDCDGNYFTSPLGEGDLAKIAMTILDKVFGNEWFVPSGFPSGEAGISNKLWADLKLVGAKDFNSWFDQVEIFSEAEKWMISAECHLGREVHPVPGDYARSLANCGVCRYYFVTLSKGRERVLTVEKDGLMFH